MAIPEGAKVFEETLDPYDIVDFEVDVSPVLETGEGVASYTVTLPTESSLLGLELKNSGGYTTTLVANILKIWLGVALIEQANSAFTSGVILPIEISVTTDSVPPRKKQRTVAVKVIQR